MYATVKLINSPFQNWVVGLEFDDLLHLAKNTKKHEVTQGSFHHMCPPLGITSYIYLLFYDSLSL